MSSVEAYFKCNYLPGQFLLLPQPFYYSISAPGINNVLQLNMCIANYITEHCGKINNLPIYDDEVRLAKCIIIVA